MWAKKRNVQLVGLVLLSCSIKSVAINRSLRFNNFVFDPSYIKVEQSEEDKFIDAVKVIESAGIDIEPLCQPRNNFYGPLVQICDEIHINSRRKRKIERGDQVTRNLIKLDKQADEDDDDDFKSAHVEENLSPEDEAIDLIMSFICVTLAALAAGLTMGLLSLDHLELKMKKRVSDDEEERLQSEALLPVVQDHHRLLVTLLLLNSIANEALPLFLDELVPGYVAVILSVTLVLFFGEIIPSAIFTGPNQLAISSKMVPLVRFFLVILAPLAVPIAKMLDKVLGHNEDGEKYDRRELSALVRIMYEERLAEKQRRKTKGLTRKESEEYEKQEFMRCTTKRSPLRFDEVTIVEGALQMSEKTVKDILTPWKKVKCEKKSEVLTTETIDRLYHHGHSRIPVYDDTSSAHSSGDLTKAVCGICLTRDLIVIYPRFIMTTVRISDMKLVQPQCIGPNVNLVDALNKLQDGLVGVHKGGHLAVVCLDPDKANNALEKGLPIPSEAGVLGVVSLEDVIEEIIQEEIYDESDKKDAINYGSMRSFV